MSETIKTNLLIIGSGPAGYTAGIYGARAGLNPVLVTGSNVGGQLMISPEIENYPGFRKGISGPKLMEEMHEQSLNSGVKIVQDTLQSVHFSKHPFVCEGISHTYEAKSVVIATGAQVKWLGLESENFFKGYGVSACAVCDGPFFREKKVAIIGGGNTAVEEALFLSKLASEVILIHRRDELRAEDILKKRLMKDPKIRILWDSVIEEIEGNQDPKYVTGVKIRNLKTEESFVLSVSGVFIAIGYAPSTSIFKDKINLDAQNYILTNPENCQTNVPGVFAAGDVQDRFYRQAITAAAQGCMAAANARNFLENIKD